MKFGDFYVWKTIPLNETKFVMEKHIPITSGPLKIIEINYDTLFDPPKTARLYKILVSPSAQLQHM